MAQVFAGNVTDTPIVDASGRVIAGGEWAYVDPDDEALAARIERGDLVVSQAKIAADTDPAAAEVLGSAPPRPSKKSPASEPSEES